MYEGKKERKQKKTKENKKRIKTKPDNPSPTRGIEPRSPAWQAGILATILCRTTSRIVCNELPWNCLHSSPESVFCTARDEQMLFFLSHECSERKFWHQSTVHPCPAILDMARLHRSWCKAWMGWLFGPETLIILGKFYFCLFAVLAISRSIFGVRRRSKQFWKLQSASFPELPSERT